MPSGSCRSYSSSNDEFSLPLLSRGNHASFDGSSKALRKNMLPEGERYSEAFFIVRRLHITFLAKIKALSPHQIVITAQRHAQIINPG